MGRDREKYAGRSREQALDDILLSAASRYSSIQAIVAHIPHVVAAAVK